MLCFVVLCLYFGLFYQDIFHRRKSKLNFFAHFFFSFYIMVLPWFEQVLVFGSGAFLLEGLGFVLRLEGFRFFV